MATIDPFPSTINSSPLTLILFDIDGTLLNIYGAGRKAFSRALETAFGWEDDLETISFAGATDLIVLHRIMQEQGHGATEEQERKFFEHLPLELERTIVEAEHRLHPGAGELLELLSRDPRCLLGLVTGNIQACAIIKLRQFDLQTHFGFGGFGDDHADRAELARLAIERARAHLKAGQEIERVFLVGDALSDVRAAKAVGATSIAVTTGSHGRKELLAAGADHVVPDLSDTRGLLSVLGLSDG